jgi:hypothetical protein
LAQCQLVFDDEDTASRFENAFLAKLAHGARQKCASHPQHFRQLILGHLKFKLVGASNPG